MTPTTPNDLKLSERLRLSLGLGSLGDCSAHLVNEAQKIHTLTPSLPRAFVRVFLRLSLVFAIGAVAQRYYNGHWGTGDLYASLVIPLLFMPTFVCLMFVPRRIQWSAAEFQIEPRFGCVQTFPWTQLCAFGRDNDVFLLQFTGVTTLRIFGRAFPRAEWLVFRSFLTTNHPDKKAWFWLGEKAIR